jgi:hypothetical protein
MRKRINRAAVCSSENYSTSKRLHLSMLEEKHSHFKSMTVNGEIAIDVPVLKGERITPKFKTIRVFGKNMRVGIEEYNTHCKKLGL